LEDPGSSHYKVLQRMAKSDPNPQDLDITDSIFVTQKCVLILIFVSTIGNSWRNTSGWLSEASLCSWNGITCNDGDLVAGINLANQNCRGTLATETGALSQSLRSLNLKHTTHFYRASYPRTWECSLLFRLSTSVGVNSQDCCRQKSTTFPIWSNYTSTTTTFLVQYLPASLNVSRSKVLSFNSNDFTGSSIPIEIGSMENRAILSLNGCNISSTISPQFGNLSNLPTLDVSRNNLVGNIPSEFGGMSLLERLYLSEYLFGSPFVVGTYSLSFRALITVFPLITQMTILASMEQFRKGWHLCPI
jgi:Leucine-rich repeat (LRR) protein